MSVVLPEFVDVARMVSGRRSFRGTLPLAAMPRLCESLAATEGAITYQLDFGTGALGHASLAMHVEACLPLMCQRRLVIYEQAVTVDQDFGLICHESEEPSLPEGCEAILVTDGRLSPRNVIEDELILAVPLVPLSPGEPMDCSTGPSGEEIEGARANPFAVLGELKKQ